MLRTPTQNLQVLISDDSTALEETARLFRFGVLLIEIALEIREPAVQVDQYEYDASRLERLSLVERAMGAEYCRATAWCLRYREPRLLGLDLTCRGVASIRRCLHCPPGSPVYFLLAGGANLVRGQCVT